MRTRSFFDVKSHDNTLDSVSTDDCRVVPNMCLSVKEILRRFQCGTLTDLSDSNYYDDDDVNIDTAPLSYEDLTDLSDNTNKIEGIINSMRQSSKKSASDKHQE